jgi:tetratricopeptide (TPR) repeat protein
MKHYAYYNLGRIYEKKGEWEAAMKYYEDSFTIKRDFDLARSALIRITAMMN